MFLKDKKVFLEYFPYLMNFHLTKDVGQIPNAFKSVYTDYNSYILTPENDDYSDLEKYAPNVELIHIKEYKILKWDVTPYLFFFKNARKIDVLYLYHFPYDFYEAIRIGLLYKLIKPRGKLFVRLEADLNYLNIDYPFGVTANNLRQNIKRYVYQLFYKCYFSKIDYFGIADFRNFEGLEKFKKLQKLVKNNRRQQLNGFNDDHIKTTLNIQNSRKNYIILTGRHELPVKGLDVFLNALKFVDLKDWQIYIAGSDEKVLLNLFFKEFGQLDDTIKEKIQFLGYLESKSALIDLLKTTRIFVLPSRFDGMPLGAVEAMATGNAIISSDHYGMQVALEKGSIGLLFKNGNEKDLADKLNMLIENNELIDQLSNKAIKKAYSEFEWKQIIKKIFDK
jgi:glycosyltransferase involved in cell wall biosynthesis